MPTYIAAYDVENLEYCLPACRKLVEIHRRFAMPATFFIVGRLLAQQGKEYAALLGDDPLFEVGSHTKTHKSLRNHPFCGPAVADDEIRSEIVDGVKLVEDTFQRRCVGLRPGCGFDVGFKGAPVCLAALAEAGVSYTSSLLWGPDFTMPAPLNQPFTYAEDGHPALWEIPGHGWHDNVAKARSWKRSPTRMIAWPPTMPEAVLKAPLYTSQDQFALERIMVDCTIRDDVGFLSLVWHPWSLHAFDPDLKMLDLLFAYVQEKGLPTSTYADYCATLKAPVPA